MNVTDGTTDLTGTAAAIGASPEADLIKISLQGPIRLSIRIPSPIIPEIDSHTT